jgi:hypothetical protein
LELPEIAFVGLDCDHGRAGVAAQEVCRRKSHVRATVDDEIGIAHPVETAILTMHEELPEYVNVAGFCTDAQRMPGMLAVHAKLNRRDEARPQALDGVVRSRQDAEIFDCCTEVLERVAHRWSLDRGP